MIYHPKSKMKLGKIGIIPNWEETDFFLEKYGTIYHVIDLRTDRLCDVIEDIDRVVGKDSLTHFGEYEDDSVYVRNDRLKCEYEILLRVGKFEDRLEGNLLYKDDKIFLKANPLGEEE